jgi:uncharacterized damage-inducible protein DinB
VGVAASAVLFGGSFLSVVSVITDILRRALDERAWSAGIALFTVAFSVGQTLGPVVSGAVADLTGTLSSGFALSAVVLAVSAAGRVAGRSRHRRVFRVRRPLDPVSEGRFSMIEHIDRLFRHMTWADDRLFTLMKDIDLDADAGRETARLLAHLIAAERVWLLRATAGDPSSVPIWPDWPASETAGVARETRAGYQRLLDGLDQRDLRRIVEYRNSKGVAFQTELGDILLHVAMHGSYHRGQIAAAVRRGGGEPFNTDYITWARETG